MEENLHTKRCTRLPDNQIKITYLLHQLNNQVKIMDTNEITLVKFLNTGHLAKLQVGMNLYEVIQYLGLPQNFHYKVKTINNFKRFLRNKKKHKKGSEFPAPLYHFYGEDNIIELATDFQNDTLLYIKLRNYHEMKSRILPHPLNHGWVDLLYNMKPEEFLEFLEKNQIDYHKKILGELPDKALFITIKASCVSVNFIFDNIHPNGRVYIVIKDIAFDSCQESENN